MPDKISLLRVLFSRKELSVWTEEVKSTMKCIVYRNPANFYETFVEILFTQTTERSPLSKKGYQERSKMHDRRKNEFKQRSDRRFPYVFAERETICKVRYFFRN